jgi:hypothetical protein
MTMDHLTILLHVVYQQNPITSCRISDGQGKCWVSDKSRQSEDNNDNAESSPMDLVDFEAHDDMSGVPAENEVPMSKELKDEMYMILH